MLLGHGDAGDQLGKLTLQACGDRCQRVQLIPEQINLPGAVGPHLPDGGGCVHPLSPTENGNQQSASSHSRRVATAANVSKLILVTPRSI